MKFQAFVETGDSFQVESYKDKFSYSMTIQRETGRFRVKNDPSGSEALSGTKR
jgi:hypothetical protein